jgi:DNA invertase Pin-like site-specific DNA recombinase
MTRHHGKYISYLRVSTAKQGQSGLGLEAQRAAVASLLNGGNWQVLEEIVEIESGKSHRNRPELQRALAACKVYGAKLIISRLDRLSRDPVFLLSLRDAGIDFVCCDNPQATRLTIGVLAMVAEQEREAISTRTKSALQAAKARGVKLGNPRPETAGFHNRRAAKAAGLKGGKAAQESADKFAELIRPLLEGDLARLSANSTAQELNRRGVQTPRGGTWTATSILNLKARLKP